MNNYDKPISNVNFNNQINSTNSNGIINDGNSNNLIDYNDSNNLINIINANETISITNSNNVINNIELNNTVVNTQLSNLPNSVDLNNTINTVNTNNLINNVDSNNLINANTYLNPSESLNSFQISTRWMDFFRFDSNINFNRLYNSQPVNYWNNHVRINMQINNPTHESERNNNSDSNDSSSSISDNGNSDLSIQTPSADNIDNISDTSDEIENTFDIINNTCPINEENHSNFDLLNIEIGQTLLDNRVNRLVREIDDTFYLNEFHFKNKILDSSNLNEWMTKKFYKQKKRNYPYMEDTGWNSDYDLNWDKIPWKVLLDDIKEESYEPLAEIENFRNFDPSNWHYLSRANDIAQEIDYSSFGKFAYQLYKINREMTFNEFEIYADHYLNSLQKANRGYDLKNAYESVKSLENDFFDDKLFQFLGAHDKYSLSKKEFEKGWRFNSNPATDSNSQEIFDLTKSLTDKALNNRIEFKNIFNNNFNITSNTSPERILKLQEYQVLDNFNYLKGDILSSIDCLLMDAHECLVHLSIIFPNLLSITL